MNYNVETTEKAKASDETYARDEEDKKRMNEECGITNNTPYSSEQLDKQNALEKEHERTVKQALRGKVKFEVKIALLITFGTAIGTFFGNLLSYLF